MSSLLKVSHGGVAEMQTSHQVDTLSPLQAADN